MAKKKLDEASEIEARLGQYLSAFGAGAGVRYPDLGAVDALRKRYYPCVQWVVKNKPDAWEKEGPWVVTHMKKAGKLAGELAKARGSLTIMKSEALSMVIRVELSVAPCDNHPPHPLSKRTGARTGGNT